ncbi:MAG: Ig-like domain-containing protein [Gemmatimonadota bacterium]|nr:Ig-like domain-containing protein [Gemmatimonadota bacterium]
MLGRAGLRRQLAITALVAFGAAACGVTEPDSGTPDPSGLSISSSTTNIGIGATLQLSATVTPTGAPQSVAWSSADEGRVTVGATGLATAAVAPLEPSTVRITATSTVDPAVSSFVDLTITCGPLLSAVVTNGGTLSEDTCYFVENPLTVNDGTLFVEPGVEISFGPSGSLSIGSNGRLNAVGTVDKGITFTSLDAAGSWRGLRFDGSRGADNVLHYVEIENGGSSGWSGATQSASAVLLEGNSLVDIQNSTIRGSESRGITLYAEAEMTFQANVLQENAVPAWLHPNTVGFFGADNVFDGNADQVVRVGYGNTDRVSTAQTWLDVGVPLEIQDRMFIEAPLTLEPGVHLQALAGVSLIVREEGTLSAIGTPTASIRFEGSESSPGAWKGLQIQTMSNDNVFDHAWFRHGGSDAWTGGGDSRAMVYLDANSKAVFTNSTFEGSAHYGLWVPAGGDIEGFSDNAFVDNARAMIVHPNRAGAIASNSIFVGNAEQRVRVTFGNNDSVESAQTWNALEVPYLVMDRTFVRAPLTIEAGAVVEFDQHAHLILNEGGSLDASGTAEAPIHFTGREALAGYWKGIQFGTVSASNRIEHALFEYAGSAAWFGGSNSTGTLYITADGSLALANVAFRETGGYAAVIANRGSLSCTSVDDGGFQYYVYTLSGSGAQPACPF